jgi:hypothetical protein
LHEIGRVGAGDPVEAVGGQRFRVLAGVRDVQCGGSGPELPPAMTSNATSTGALKTAETIVNEGLAGEKNFVFIGQQVRNIFVTFGRTHTTSERE